MQNVIQPLSDAADLWDAVHVALTTLKEACGLAPISNIKQTMRALLSRILNSLSDADAAGSVQVSLKDSVSNVFYLIFALYNSNKHLDAISPRIWGHRLTANDE